MGGDETGYKSRFGNASFDSVYLQLGSIKRPYSMFIILLHVLLSGMKNISAAIGHGKLRQRIKKAIRKYGDVN